MRSWLVRVDDDTRVAETRRIAAGIARDDGLSDDCTHRAGILATEIAGNLRKHAENGEVHLRRLSAQGTPGIEIISIDRGPGMQDVDRCLSDGFSTAGTPGTGLGAVRRGADEFDVYSQPGKGTVLVARVYAARAQDSATNWRVAGVSAPVRGEEACGDSWAARATGETAEILVADGLGHGMFAADASKAAVEAFGRADGKAPAECIDLLHRALTHTRGAAVAVARLEAGGKVRYAGIGNIVGVVLGGPRQQFMISHNGTAGLAAKRVQEFEYAMPSQGAVVMHSDGLTSNWSLDHYPGLLRRHPALIAAVLYRDSARGRDDVCVVAAKWGGA